ncbi:MAG: TraR/DksA family transcriptional regulator [Bacteroidetes bacterium]|nr:TraR/DksA family transcriptional regulator [Bacteroidota bacterium]
MEFKELILKKIEESKLELKYYQDAIMHYNEHGTDDTVSSFKSFEDSSLHQEKEYLHQMAERQRIYIDNLEKALIRIENKTYGICRATGNLIRKDRLRSVPHATLSIEAKLNQH